MTLNNIPSIPADDSSPVLFLVGDLTKQTPKAAADVRRAVVRFRFTQKQKEAGQKEQTPKYVDLPRAQWDLQQFAPYLEEKLYELQDAVIRDLVERNYTTLEASDVDANAMLAFLAAQEAGGRLSKDSIGSWFDAEVAPFAALTITEKLGWAAAGDAGTLSEKQEARVRQVLTGLRDMITALSGSKTYYEPEKCAKLRQYIEFAPEEDAMRNRLLARLDAMKREEVDLLDCL